MTEERIKMKSESKYPNARVEAAYYGGDEIHRKLATDSNGNVRSMVVGICKEEIINEFKMYKDRSYAVRRIVAKRGVCLDKLVYDKHYAVRMEVAKHNIPRYLDILIKDSSPAVVNAVLSHNRQCDLDYIKSNIGNEKRTEVLANVINPVEDTRIIFNNQEELDDYVISELKKITRVLKELYYTGKVDDEDE